MNERRWLSISESPRNRLDRQLGMAQQLTSAAVVRLIDQRTEILPPLARAEELKFDMQHAYVGLRLGQGIYGQSGDEVARRLAAQGDAVSGVSLSKHCFAGAIYEGVPVWAGLGVELGMVQLGQYRATLNTSSSNPAKVTADVTRALQPAGQGLTLGFGGSVPVLGRLSLASHVAMLLYRSTQKADSAAGSFRSTKLGAGAAFSTGALYRFANDFSAGLAFDAYVEDGGTAVYLPNAQLEYHFGQ